MRVDAAGPSRAGGGERHAGLLGQIDDAPGRARPHVDADEIATLRVRPLRRAAVGQPRPQRRLHGLELRGDQRAMLVHVRLDAGDVAQETHVA